jgi:hypothetical protein
VGGDNGISSIAFGFDGEYFVGVILELGGGDEERYEGFEVFMEFALGDELADEGFRSGRQDESGSVGLVTEELVGFAFTRGDFA